MTVTDVGSTIVLLEPSFCGKFKLSNAAGLKRTASSALLDLSAPQAQRCWT